METDSNGLPTWAAIGAKRLAHIERVTSLLRAWAAAMRLDKDEARAWIDAGAWHDALRDASEARLREITGDTDTPPALLHGPAAAILLAREGEKRTPVLDAVRYHTVGSPQWDRTGRALYMADYLEPGRKFSREDRFFLAAQVPHSFDSVFRQVVRFRLDWSVREGNHIYPETVALWNSLR
ncbi:MAG: HD domain-containing protein [Gemmatimonadaceae bacterium]|nr:HD domain-containing protein [Gemmatimonadaceae bacterium]